MKTFRSLPLALAAILLAGAWSGLTATVTWTNTSGGNWSAAANWSPNAMPGSADTVLITQAGTYTVNLDTSPTIASLTLGAGSGQQRLTNTANTLTINNAATNGSNGVLDLAGGSLAGTGVWQVSSNGVFNWFGGSLSKALTVASNGVLNLSGAGTKTLSQPLTNWGTINWTGGQFILQNPGNVYNQPGALFDAQCDQTLARTYGSEFILNAGTFRKSAATGITAVEVRLDNTGTVAAQSGTLQFNNGGRLDGTFSAQAGAVVRFAGGAFVLSGTLARSGAGEVGFTDGTITFSAPITSFDWSGGSIVGPLTVASNGVLNLSGAGTKTLSQPLTNWGTINWTGGQFRLQNPGNVYNQPGALFDAQCDQTLARTYGSEFILNAGTFRKSAATGITAVEVRLDNTGTVAAQSGTLQFNNGGRLDGTFSAQAGAVVRFAGGAFVLSGTLAQGGAGEVGFTDGTITFSAPITSFDWSGGSIIGPLTVASNGVLNLSGAGTKTLSQPLTNWGTINWTGGQFILQNPGNVYNQPGALFDAQCDQTLARTYGSEFILNAGTFRKSAATGITAVEVRLDNTGTVAAQSGTLQFNNGGRLDGTFSAQAGAVVRFAGGAFVLSGTLAQGGAGEVGFTDGTITFSAPITSFDWSGGSIVGPLTVASNGVLNLSGAGTKTLSQPLTNWGTINWTGGQFRLQNPGNVYNQPGALFDIQCDQTLARTYGSEFILNAGTFRKSAATGITAIEVRLDNTGTVAAAKGMIEFSGSYTSAPTSNLRFILGGTAEGTGFGQVRFGSAVVPAGIVSGEVVSGFNPSAGTRFQVISGGLADAPLDIDRNAGNGYVFDFFRAGDTFTLVTRPGHFTLPPLLSLLKVRPGIWSFLMEGQPGLTYRIQSASELREAPPTVWTTAGTNTTPSGLIQLLVTNTVAPQQFYRAVTP